MNEDVRYLSFYNFKKAPFSLVPSPHFFFSSKRHLQILDILNFSLLQGSLISVIVGEPGVGKTQVLLTLLSNLSKKNYLKVEILNPALSPKELLISILEGMENQRFVWEDEAGMKYLKGTTRDAEIKITNSELGITEVKSEEFMTTLFKPKIEKSEVSTSGSLFIHKDLLLKLIKDRMTEIKERQAKVLIVIDEAQLLPDETLEELRLITNLNEGTEPIIQILLIGQPNLRERLLSAKFLPLRQRISVFEELKPLDKEEIMPYLWFRIYQVSEHPEISIHKNVVRTLYKFSRGIPRLINKLMDRALFIAYTKGERIITKKHIKEAKATFEEIVL